MSVRIALVGNPNSGKTTLFNALTGAAQYVGNWPGVTVEKKEGRLRFDKDVVVTDLPGVYSLAPYTPEEVVSRNYVLHERPDVIINLVDGSNLERNLYLTTQALELGVPVVVALNRIDVVRRRGDRIDVARLSRSLGCPIVETSALKGIGVREVALKALEVAVGRKERPLRPFSPDVEAVLTRIEEGVKGRVPDEQARWYAVKMLERDTEATGRVPLPQTLLAEVDALREGLEKKHGDDSESLIINERYLFVDSLLGGAAERRRRGESASERIDRVMTHRLWALPLFAVVMFGVYWLSISTLGSMGTRWINETAFGKEGLPAMTAHFLQGLGVHPLLESLIVDGILGGVGAVLGFLPQIAVLYLCLSLLEDLGYMARIAFIMDRIFHKFGLSGKSLIPILIGTGCSVPGIMGARTIEDEKDRRMTVILTSFMPCSAKLPIIGLVANALFQGAWWMAPVTYFICIAGILASGIVLKKTRLFAGRSAPFIMELPDYHLPSPRNLLIHTWDRTRSFASKAGTVILLATVALWFLMRFTPSLTMIEFNTAGDGSILAALGSFFAPLFAPLGFGSWEAAVSTFSGLIAKEQLVATLGIMTHLGDVDAATGNAALLTTTAKMFSPLGAFSFLLFNLFCTPCVAAMAAIAREMGSAKWTLFAFAYQTGFAYAVSLTTYQFGILLFEGAPFSAGTAIALSVTLWGLWLFLRTDGAKK